MIREYGIVNDVIKNYHGYDLWMLADGVTIRLPADNSRIPEPIVGVITEVKLGLGSWEYDYWLGQQ